MKKFISFKSILIFLVFLLLIIQSIRIDKSTKPINPETDFVSLTQANANIANLLKMACYDCHSSQSTFPWYTNVAPISWWIKNHINEGKEKLNFSEWGIYTDKRKNHKVEECIELVEEGEMPLSSYTMIHSDSKLTDSQKLDLILFFKALKNNTSSSDE
jgi:hypothetical protein